MTRTQRRGRRGIGLDVVPDRLRHARREAGLTQAQLAGDELNRQAVSQFELGQAKPSAAALVYIAKRTGCSVDWLRGFTTIIKENRDGA